MVLCVHVCARACAHVCVCMCVCWAKAVPYHWPRVTPGRAVVTQGLGETEAPVGAKESSPSGSQSFVPAQ